MELHQIAAIFPMEVLEVLVSFFHGSVLKQINMVEEVASGTEEY